MKVDLTELSRNVIDVLAWVGPWLTGLTLAGFALMAVNKRSRARLLLAGRGYQHKGGPRWRLWIAGTLIPLVGLTALATAFAIEAEIRNGPNRMAAGLESLVPPTEGERFWVLEAGTDHFMNESVVGDGVFDHPGEASLAAFTLDLASIQADGNDRVTGLVLGPGRAGPLVSPRISGDSECERAADRCELRPGELVADPDDGYQLGQSLHIRGETYRVVAYFDRPMSLLNRSVVYAIPPRGSAQAAFGFVVDAPNRQVVEAAVAGQGLQVLSTDELRERNSDFWAGNGTPILMLLILMIAVFGGSAIFAGQRAEHAAVRPVFRTVRSVGLTSIEAAQVDLARGLLRVLIPAPLAVVVSCLAIGLLNHVILGFHASVEAGTVTAALGVVILASVCASTTSWVMERREPLVGG